MITAEMLANTKEYFHVGVVSGAHALKGEMRVFPTTDDPERFVKGLKLYAKKDGPQGGSRGEGGRQEGVRSQGEGRGHGHRVNSAVTELCVEQARAGGKFVLVKCKEVNSVEEAEKLKGADLFVSREDAIPLEEGEYFVADLIGLSIEDEDGREIGTLKDVISAPANDVYVMQHLERDKEVLLPAIKQCILNVDMERRVMTVHLLDGLLDL